MALAKRPLAAGETLDGIGGFTCYGEVDTARNARGLLPVGLAEDVRLARAVEQGEPVPLAAVELDEARPIVRLWRRQQAMESEAADVAA